MAFRDCLTFRRQHSETELLMTEVSALNRLQLLAKRFNLEPNKRLFFTFFFELKRIQLLILTTRKAFEKLDIQI